MTVAMLGHGHHHQFHGAPGATPVLDIGGEVGALIVYLASQPATGELHACPAGDSVARFHTGVHQREMSDTTAWVAIFPEVHEGVYHLLDEAGSPMADVAVTGGQVHQLDLR